MDAFVQIIKQLFEAVSPEAWQELAYFPFDLRETDQSSVYDVVFFHQSAREGYGIAWIEFSEIDPLLVFPFCMVRYQTDGAVITLSPWSIRDARSDDAFFHHMRSALRRANPLVTMRGQALAWRSLPGEPAQTAVAIEHVSSHLSVRVDSLEAFKFFRTVERGDQAPREVDMLEYLSSSPEFDGTAKLVASLEYQMPAGAFQPIAVSMTYVQNLGNLWSHLLVLLQQARYPRGATSSNVDKSWKKCLDVVSQLGRLAADFHRLMMNARRPRNIAALAPAEADVAEWKASLEDYLEQLLNRAAALDLKNRFTPSYLETVENLSAVAQLVRHEIEKLASPGLLIQTHGHLHLGQILVGLDRFVILDFQSDQRRFHEFETRRQSGLDDYAALFISLEFAWEMSTHGPESSALADVLDEESEYGAYFYEQSRALQVDSDSGKTLDLIHESFAKSYFRTLRDDPLTSELFPASSSGLESLLNVYLFIRLLRELCCNAQPGNPKAHIVLRMVKTLERRLSQGPVFV